MKKAILILILVISSAFILPITPVIGKKSNSQKISSNELTSFREKFSFTLSNISNSNIRILAGPIFGGRTNYLVVAFFEASVPMVLQLNLFRGKENVYIILSRSHPVFSGNLSFTDCCTYVLQNLYLNINYASSVSLENQTGIIYTMFYAIYSNPPGGTNFLNISSIKKNVLGYPYPSHAYELSLFILLIGQIPVALLDYFLDKNKRRKKKN